MGELIQIGIISAFAARGLFFLYRFERHSTKRRVGVGACSVSSRSCAHGPLAWSRRRRRERPRPIDFDRNLHHAIRRLLQLLAAVVEYPRVGAGAAGDLDQALLTGVFDLSPRLWQFTTVGASILRVHS